MSDEGKPSTARKFFNNQAKNIAGLVIAGISTFSAPRFVSAAQSHYNSNDPVIVLPSQEAYAERAAILNDKDYENPVVRIAKDKRVWAGIGACGVGAGGFFLYQASEKKKAEQMRSSLSGMTGLNVDASILDEARINRPGAKTYEYKNAPQFGTYRPPAGKLMKDVRDKYVFNKKESEVLLDKVELDIFKTGEEGKAQQAKDAGARKTEVEVVDGSKGPKTAEQKSLDQELEGLTMDEIMAKAAANPGAAMDPALMAAALPQLQQQLAQVLKEGVSREDVQEVKATFRDMGVDIEDMFKRVEEMEKAGMTDSLGPQGVEFFKTLRTILKDGK